MRDLPELALNCGIDFGMPVAVKVRPDRGIGIQVLAASDIPQPSALTFDDDDGLTPEPIAHLGKGMPDVLVIELGEPVHRRAQSSTGTTRLPIM